MKGKKTYLVAFLMFLHGLSAIALKDGGSVNIQELLMAVAVATLRAGVTKSGPTPPSHV